MQALTVTPQLEGSARLQEVPEPSASDGDLLVTMLAVGICGTDREIIDGKYGQAPPSTDALILGHESLGRVLEAPAKNRTLRAAWAAPTTTLENRWSRWPTPSMSSWSAPARLRSSSTRCAGSALVAWWRWPDSHRAGTRSRST